MPMRLGKDCRGHGYSVLGRTETRRDLNIDRIEEQVFVTDPAIAWKQLIATLSLR